MTPRPACWQRLCSLFGVEPRRGYYTATSDGLLGLLEAVTDARAQVIILGLVLARI